MNKNKISDKGLSSSDKIPHVPDIKKPHTWILSVLDSFPTFHRNTGKTRSMETSKCTLFLQFVSFSV